MKYRWFSAALLGLALGCGGGGGDDEHSHDGHMTKAQAKTAAIAIIPEATVEDVMEHSESGVAHMMVMMRMPSGGSITVEFVEESGKLDQIEADKGPFDYDVAPMADVLKLSEAKAKALEAKQGTLEVWEFHNHEHGTQWELYVRATDQKLWEVTLGAADGAVASVEETAQPD